MGLDAVELVMAVEEKFGISISDEEASDAITVGDLKRIVRSKLEITDSNVCLSQRAFHQIRTKAVGLFGISRRGIRPSTLLEDIVPRAARERSWRDLQTALAIPALPELVRSSRVNLTVTLVVLSALVGPVWYGALCSTRVGLWMSFGAALATLAGIVLARITRPMKTAFKRGYESVGDLSRFLVARYPEVVGKPRATSWTEEEISSLLRDVIIEQVRVSEFDDNSRFVQDLHID